MPYKIPEFQHFPHVIPDASQSASGVMSQSDKAKVDSLAAPGPWVGLNYAAGGGGYADGSVPAQSRVNGDYVQLRGIVKNTNNKSALSPIALLPANQAPTKPRLVPTLASNGAGTPNYLVIDDGSLFGTPGMVLLNFAYAANNSILLDGLSFSI